MSYSINLNPSTVAVGEDSTSTVTLPDREDTQHQQKVVDREGNPTATAILTVTHERLTIGVVGEDGLPPEGADYGYDSGGLPVEQVGDREFVVTGA